LRRERGTPYNILGSIQTTVFKREDINIGERQKERDREA
jgi:hypothetical protein